MPISVYRLARLLASGLLILATFTSARAQETPVDPNYEDVPLAQDPAPGFHPVTQLACPENDYPNCGPVPWAWHPPVFYPLPEMYCPTGVVHRDWWREKTIGFHAARRQRMLEKDYAFQVEHGAQSQCCPPWSCWGHYCDECPNIGCKNRWNWFGLGGNDCNCEACGNGCGVNTGCQSIGDETSAVSPAGAEVQLVQFNEPAAEGASTPVVQLADAIALPLAPATSEIEQADFASDEGNEGIQLISDERLAGSPAGVQSAGFVEISDRPVSVGGVPAGNIIPVSGPIYSTGGWGHGDYCPPEYGYGDPYVTWEECEGDDDCDLFHKCFKHCFKDPYHCFCHMLREDGVGPVGPMGGVRGRGGRSGWRREIPRMGQYYIAYPQNPHYFDQRDGRIYAAQGYGHPVGVPLAPNVEHTYNYGWGVPSSRLSPVSRMPGAPGVAVPAVPGAAGPGVLPPALPVPLPGGFGR